MSDMGILRQLSLPSTQPCVYFGPVASTFERYTNAAKPVVTSCCRCQ
jgi:hypothetical protein